MNEHRHPERRLPAEDARGSLNRQTRRSLLVGGVAAAAGFGAYQWITGAGKSEDDSLAAPERKILDVNGKLSAAYLSNSHLLPEYPASQIGGVKQNGSIGMSQPLDRKSWKMQVTSVTYPGRRDITLQDIQSLPRVEMITRFCCIEGWSGISQWAGVRFADFTKHLLGTRTEIPAYMYLETADKEYFVGLDRKSALHPQTLLAYEQNGRPLEDRRGAPLRLVIPVKYGIKNIKRIARIQYTNDKPADYWAEDGYDWFAGL